MRIPRKLVLALIAGGLAAPVLAGANTPPTPRQAISQHVAEADAYRKLAAAIESLRIKADVHVRDLVARSDEVRAAFDRFICEIEPGKPTWQKDDTCALPAEVPLARVTRQLAELRQKLLATDTITRDDIDGITRQTERTVIKVVGFGVPRDDLPPGLPDCVIERVQAPPPPPDPIMPVLWRRISPAARRAAEEAARYDAICRLAERIKALQIGPGVTVRDLAVTSDEITRCASRRWVAAAPIVARTWYYHDDPLVATTIEVPGRVVARTIEELHDRSIQRGQPRPGDVRSAVRSLESPTFRATGVGAPDKRSLETFNATLNDPAARIPAWAVSPIRATGTAPVGGPKPDEPRAKLSAARAAEAAARRSLADAVLTLEVASKTQVKDLIARHEALQAHLDGVLMDATVEKTAFQNASATVTVSTSGIRVWQIVHEWLRFGRQ